MSKRISNKEAAPSAGQLDTNSPNAIAADVHETMERAMARKLKARALIIPARDEDAVINKAARSDPDNPPMTHQELAQLKPARRPRGRPAQEATKVPVSIRFDNLVLDSFKALGDGWQTRINDVLMQYLIDTRQLRHRFHATIRSPGHEMRPLDQFMVLAIDAAQAREKVKQHLLACGRKDPAPGRIEIFEIGNAVIHDALLLVA
jgi:uncharacterized protein (DUF4415 family)